MLFAKSLWYHNLFINNYKFTICFVISLSIHYLLCEFSLNLLSFSRNHLQSTFFREITINSLYVSRVQRESTILFAELRLIFYAFHFITVNTLSALRFFSESTIYFVISLWIQYQFRDFTMNSLYILGIHFECTICFAILLCIHNLLREFPQYEFAICFLNSPWIDFFRQITLNSLCFLRLHLESIFPA